MMASACVNNVGMSPDNFLDCPSYSSYSWLSPRISFSRDLVDDGSKIAGKSAPPSPLKLQENAPEKSDLEAPCKDLIDFEFRLDDPVTMLPADELFSEGKLVPLQLAAIRPLSDQASDPFGEIRFRSPCTAKSRLTAEISGSDPYVFSPKAPRCSSRWRELLGLKKIRSPNPELQKSASVPTKSPSPKSLRHFLHRTSKSASIDSSLSLPLLRDSDSDSVSFSSRLSLSSSSSSGPDHEDLPRLSLDPEKTNPSLLSMPKNPPRIRISKPRAITDPTARVRKSPMRRTSDSVTPSDPTVRIGRSPIRRAPDSTAIPARGVSVDSPRMNSSGKIVFQSLERSSSSPSSFYGGSRNGKIRGMERSYSANVRITPVLNVPVCSLRGSSKGGSVFGFGQLFSPQKKESRGSSARAHNGSRNDRI